MNELKERLMRQYGYAAGAADMMTEDLRALDERLSPILARFLAGEADTDETIFDGYSVENFKKRFGMNEFAALATLDFALKEPERARLAFARGIR